MDYNLTKQLKDAGFPQPKVGCHECSEGRIQYDDGIYAPTLSELILEVYKYCHEVRLECVKDNPGVWASCTCWGNGHEDDWQTGNSPEESLAKLWLTLQ